MIASGMIGAAVIPAPDARRPRIGLRINGQDAPGLLEFSAENNAYRGADIFTAELTLSPQSGFGPEFWAETDAIDIELLAWLEGRTPPTTIVRGLVDKLSFAFGGSVLRLCGRDYAGLLIDARTSEKFADQTLSQIAATLAARHLLPDGQPMRVQAVPTTTKAGDFYRAGHVTLTDEISEWTLLQWLAEQEGLDVFVAGPTLFVQPPPGPEQPPLGVLYRPLGPADPVARATAGRIEAERVLTLSRDIRVTVRSWSHGQKRAIEVTRRGSRLRRPGARDTRRGLPPHDYVFTVPGLTQVQAERLAEAKLAELSRHERVLTVSGLPALPDLTVRRMLRLSGTGTAFDQDYFIAEITRRFGWQGTEMCLRARNASPRNQMSP